jgi:hypothetical protein
MDKFPTMRLIVVTLLVLCTGVVHAHQPDLSNIMIFEQDGKNLLMIRSALTAFEGEVDFHYQKGAYKTPEAFIQLVIKRFEHTCRVIINNETIRLINPRVVLGHETTVVAELVKVPQTIKSYYIKNAFFEDMPSNQCELILTAKGLPQKQFILNNTNNQEVRLRVKNAEWIVNDSSSSFVKNLLWGAIFVIVGTFTIAVIKGRK